MEIKYNNMKFKTDKITYHNFWGFYENHFKKIKNKNLNILEIGILNGESLKLLKSYFENSVIYGIDINKIELNEERINTFQMSQVDFDAYGKYFENVNFDIIIDDGSHITSHQIDTFTFLFENKLNKGGLYVIEDLHTSFRPEYINTKITCFELVKNLKDDEFLKNNFTKIYDFKEKINETYIFQKNENDFNDSITSIIYKNK